jgi:tRNA dimethylallyltransferase
MLFPEQEFSAGEFGSRGREVIQQIIERGHTPMVVGGSGLYVRSLIDGLFEGPGTDRALRANLQLRLQDEGIESLLKELHAVDPEAARRADPTKPRRILRALEIFHSTGTPISAHHAGAKVKIGFTTVQVGLAWERSELYRRIEQRCDAMLAAGLLKEVELLEQRGYTPALNALNTVGYAEAFAYRRGEMSFEEMVRQFKQNSRRYAKRQLTWFRADERITWLRVDASDDLRGVADRIVEIFQKHAHPT